MSIGLLIVTHNTIGADLLDTAKDILGKLPIKVAVVNIKRSSNYEKKVSEVEKNIVKLNQGEGVLVLTDIFGATPSNIAVKAAKATNTKVIAGINLPMLLRIFNYSSLPLEKIIDKAINAGHDSIFECDRNQ
jgi:PTS system mannose-specific IIA component